MEAEFWQVNVDRSGRQFSDSRYGPAGSRNEERPLLLPYGDDQRVGFCTYRRDIANCLGAVA